VADQIGIVYVTGKVLKNPVAFMSETGPATMESFSVVNERLLANMRQIDKRQWRLWTAAISITLSLAIGIASFALPALVAELDTLHAFFLNHEIRGLLGLVLIFNVYIVYEQIQLNRLRHQFAEDLYKMAVLDPVTNMFNRRYIIHRLEEEIARCRRHGTPLTVIALDLDSFKQINDEHGHAVGDYVLRIFGEQLKRATRGSDVVARYGGDEFLAILPDCNAEQIQYVLSRLNGLHIKTGKSTTDIRYSAGWTDYLPGESLEDLLKRADDMLYANKRNPRGTFVSTVVAE
jgi:diguanylate cyclase (GGDEF)-like protein